MGVHPDQAVFLCICTDIIPPPPALCDCSFQTFSCNTLFWHICLKSFESNFRNCMGFWKLLSSNVSYFNIALEPYNTPTVVVHPLLSGDNIFHSCQWFQSVPLYFFFFERTGLLNPTHKTYINVPCLHLNRKGSSEISCGGVRETSSSFSQLP